jgi:signal transduction histidine kinase
MAQVADRLNAELDQKIQLDAAAVGKGLAKYRQTILFAITALLVMSIGAWIATTKVNSVIANLAETQLIELAEENTRKDAQHIQSMVAGGGMMAFMGQDMAVVGGVAGMAQGSDGSMAMSTSDSMVMASSDTDAGDSAPFTLDLLIGSSELTRFFSGLLEGLGVVESRLLSPAGEILWSDHLHAEPAKHQAIQLDGALAGNISSKLLKDRKIIDLDGTVRIMDVVETFVPLRDSPTSPVIGVLEIRREVGTDLDQLVNETKSTVVLTTVATMAGLFLALVGFVVVSDRMIYRSNQRELALVEGRLAERNRAQQQIAASEKLAAMGQLSAGLAHDLRNPLGAIKNSAYLLKKKMISDRVIDANSDFGRYLEIIEQQVAKSNGTITDLLTFSRVRPPTLTGTDIDLVLQEFLKSWVGTDNVELSQHVEPNLSQVMADGDQLQRVFLNLANNAQEAMPDGGRLTVTAKSVNKSVEIEFTDTGEGISDENIERIFDPLFTTKTKGTGLGLAVCQEIVKQHGGTISARRNEESICGTVIQVKLPAIQMP